MTRQQKRNELLIGKGRKKHEQHKNETRNRKIKCHAEVDYNIFMTVKHKKVANLTITMREAVLFGECKVLCVLALS